MAVKTYGEEELLMDDALLVAEWPAADHPGS